MTSIKLTEAHKAKLLEMCEKLFPEYFFDEEGEDYYIDDNNIINFLIPIKENEFKGEGIHWFEFCMTHLADKMLQLGELPNYDNKLDYEFNSILQSSWWESHPVDYLYKEFKKLKK